MSPAAGRRGRRGPMVESRGVKLVDLLRDVEGARIIGDPRVTVSFLSYQSSLAGPGHLFCCVPGQVHDGHDFAAEAVERGAVALCVERELALPVPQAVVPSVRAAMGPAAAMLYEHPSARLATVGVTGTNGKTTTAFLTAFLLDDQGRRAGLLGTVERRIGGVTFPAERTTPEALDIQQDLAMMVDVGDQAAVLEVSSHALELDRAGGITFAAVAFTNLTQDHLDFHGTLDNYFAAKSRLFLAPQFARSRPVAVVNIDDPFGRVLAERLTPDRLLTFSVEGEPADLMASGIVTTEAGSSAHLIVRGRAAAAVARNQGRPIRRGEEIDRRVETQLLGGYNVANMLTSLGLGIGLGLDLEAMLAAVPRFTGVPGRLERVERGQDFTVAVDYAHTPDSVENVLRAGREVTKGRLIAVVGCGGDRDRGKRPLMGAAAERGADLVVITSDNPRSEEPGSIIDDILAGLSRPAEAVVEVDRRLAIKRVLREARSGDVVLILGKGHERGQEFAERIVPFDDREVAAEALTELLGDRG